MQQRGSASKPPASAAWALLRTGDTCKPDVTEFLYQTPAVKPKEAATMARKKAHEGATEPKAAHAATVADKPARPRKAHKTDEPIHASRNTPLPSPRATLPVISSQVRHSMIAEAAYYRAEKRGDGPGDPDQDWYEAEAEIEQMLEGLVAG